MRAKGCLVFTLYISRDMMEDTSPDLLRMLGVRSLRTKHVD